MSLRDALRAAVACCTPLPMQHATFVGNDATGDATTVQPPAANPHGTRASHATGSATDTQQAIAIDATRGEKLQVARTSECNTQLSPLIFRCPTSGTPANDTAKPWRVTLAPGIPPETVAKFRAASLALDAAIAAEGSASRERIRGAGGVASVARDCWDVFNNLK